MDGAGACITPVEREGRAGERKYHGPVARVYHKASMQRHGGWSSHQSHQWQRFPQESEVVDLHYAMKRDHSETQW